MTRPITLHTVPHTGTNFVLRIFRDVFGLRDTAWERTHAPRLPRSKLQQPHLKMIQTAVDAQKLVVTARDPYLSAIRWTSISTRDLPGMRNAWEYFFEVLNQKEYFVIDIGCRKSDRVQHIKDLAKFVNMEADDKVIEDFASQWKPENSSNTDAKQIYLNSGKLPVPEAGTWDMLDDAVKWYASLETNDFS